jgi:hypothetical protein
MDEIDAEAMLQETRLMMILHDARVVDVDQLTLVEGHNLRVRGRIGRAEQREDAEHLIIPDYAAPVVDLLMPWSGVREIVFRHPSRRRE